MTVSPTLTQEVCMMEAELCSAFSDPTRILILYELDERPKTVTELTVALDVSQPTISRHLKTLRDHGLVTAERHGTSMLYHITVSDARSHHAPRQSDYRCGSLILIGFRRKAYASKKDVIVFYYRGIAPSDRQRIVAGHRPSRQGAVRLAGLVLQELP